MKKIIAIVLSFFSLTLCFCAPADAIGSESSSTTVCSESVCKKGVAAPIDGIENVVSHPFAILLRGAGWAILGAFVGILLPSSIPCGYIGLVCGIASKTISLYKGTPCDWCN